MIARTQPDLPAQALVVRALSVVALAAAMLFGTVADSSAQVLKRAVQGGLLGAGIGAIAGGGKGAGTGAAIGAGLGAVVGASEKANAAPPPPPPPHYGAPPPPHYGYAPPPRYNDPLVYDIQASLTRLGYDPGPVDGVYGQRTAEAIRAYEYNNRLPLTGQPSPNLHNHMASRGG